MTKKEAEPDKPTQEVKIFYEKSRDFRNIAITGAWVGVNHIGNVQITFFNDLRALPDVEVHRITEDDKVGETIQTIERQGLLREAEVNIVMTPEAAESIAGLLLGMIGQIKNQSNSSQNRKKRSK